MCHRLSSVYSLCGDVTIMVCFCFVADPERRVEGDGAVAGPGDPAHQLRCRGPVEGIREEAESVSTLLYVQLSVPLVHSLPALLGLCSGRYCCVFFVDASNGACVARCDSMTFYTRFYLALH